MTVANSISALCIGSNDGGNSGLAQITVISSTDHTLFWYGMQQQELGIG